MPSTGTVTVKVELLENHNARFVLNDEGMIEREAVKKYMVEGTDDATIATEADGLPSLGSVYTDDDGQPVNALVAAEISADAIGSQMFNIEVRYRTRLRGGGGQHPELNAEVWGWNFQSGIVKIECLQTAAQRKNFTKTDVVGTVGNGGVAILTYRDENGGEVVEGTDFKLEDASITVKVWKDSTTANKAWLDTQRALLRTVNDAAWPTQGAFENMFEAGEVFFDSMNFSQVEDSTVTEINYTFLASKNITEDIELFILESADPESEVASVTKKGHELRWLKTERMTPFGSAPLVLPTECNVDTLYPEAAWTALTPKGI